MSRILSADLGLFVLISARKSKLRGKTLANGELRSGSAYEATQNPLDLYRLSETVEEGVELGVCGNEGHLLKMIP